MHGINGSFCFLRKLYIYAHHHHPVFSLHHLIWRHTHTAKAVTPGSAFFSCHYVIHIHVGSALCIFAHSFTKQKLIRSLSNRSIEFSLTSGLAIVYDFHFIIFHISLPDLINVLKSLILRHVCIHTWVLLESSSTAFLLSSFNLFIIITIIHRFFAFCTFSVHFV